jgi:hypothetical protein
MGAELSIVLGLSVISALFAYFAFEFKNSAEPLNQKIGVFLFFVSVGFLNLVMYSCVLIAQNGGVAYLEHSVVNTGLTIITYTSIVAIILYFIVIFVLTVKGIVDYMRSYVKGRNREQLKH